MTSLVGLSASGRIYVWGIVAAGLCVISASVIELVLRPLPWQWFLLAALTLISGSATVKLPSIPASISISETFVFAAVLLFGTAAGTVLVALDGLVISLWISRQRREIHRALFNTAAPALSAWCSAHLYFAIVGVSPLVLAPTSLDRLLPALLLFATAYFWLNSWLITFAVVAETGLNAAQVWRQHFVWLSLNYFCGASMAFLLVTYTRNIDLRYLAAIIPLLVLLYVTFKIAMARVEDANLHVEKVDRLYLSTVETLAMAIDAKDQVTHGHIRRVQTYAIELARQMGISDSELIKAIETAALLHDMGKLAVPEYILNKPGKLTSAEFDKMKLHASVGAEILSAIGFPYPVVPIVRHHHEHWDGCGYPDGLRGTDIPIGARILAVVDCFDALTSDRPYRPKLSRTEALQVVVERRGSMYDPLVVDTFATICTELVLPEAVSLRSSAGLKEIVSSIQAPSFSGMGQRFEDFPGVTDEMLTMHELARDLAGQLSIVDTARITSGHLRRLVPFTLCVLYRYETTTDCLEAVYASGETASCVTDLRIPLGQCLSGWVAANRQTIINSDATLDLGEMACGVSPRLCACLSTPLISDDQLSGVLALYSTRKDNFDDEHRRIVEATARHVARTLRRAAGLDACQEATSPKGSMTATQLSDLGLGPVNQVRQGSRVLLIIDIINFEQVNAEFGRQAENDAVRHVAEHARLALGPRDSLFRYDSDEFIAFLECSDEEPATRVAEQISNALADHPLTLRSGDVIELRVTTTVAPAPDRDVSLRQLVDIIRDNNDRSRPYRNRSGVH